jgi:hypothetical protein
MYPLYIKKVAFTLITLLFIKSFANAKIIYVSPKGNDSNPGTRAQPLRTISRGADLAQPGDTVYVLEGVYRERVAPPRGGLPGKPIVYLAETGKKVYIKGSDIWKPNWSNEGGGIYSATPDEKMFKDNTAIDGPNPYKIALSATPQNRDGSPENFVGPVYTLGQVFINDAMLKQVSSGEELRSEDNTWYYNSGSARIYVHAASVNLATATVELTTRRRIFAPHKRGLSYISVIGFIMEHCANQFPKNFWQKPENAQAGALGLRGGSHWLIKNNVIRYANTIGIDCGSEGGNDENKNDNTISPALFLSDSSLIDGNVIEDNYVTDNGSCGITGYGSHNLVIKGNVIMRNNNLHFNGKGRAEEAAIKLHLTIKALIAGNYIADNYTFGIYFDNKYAGTRVTGNLILNNTLSGIFIEYADYPFNTLCVDNNILLDNKQFGIYETDASGATFAYNLIANTSAGGTGQAVCILQVTKRPRTYHNSFYNNIIVGFHNSIYNIDYPSNLGGEQRFDSNVYDADPNSAVFKINPFSDIPAPYTPADLMNMVNKFLPPSGHNTSPTIEDKDIKMPFNGWKTFWSNFTAKYDVHSITTRGINLTFDKTTNKLQINVIFNPNIVKITPFQSANYDYFSKQISNDNNSIPGPIQSIKQGNQTFKIWTGLTPVAEGN